MAAIEFTGKEIHSRVLQAVPGVSENYVLNLINERVPIMKLTPASTPEEIATGVLNMLLLDKIGRKPGDGGYLANVKKGDPTDVYFHYMDFDRLKDIDTVAANVSNAGGAIKANFDKIFG